MSDYGKARGALSQRLPLKIEDGSIFKCRAATDEMLVAAFAKNQYGKDVVRIPVKLQMSDGGGRAGLISFSMSQFEQLIAMAEYVFLDAGGGYGKPLRSTLIQTARHSKMMFEADEKAKPSGKGEGDA